MKFNLLFVILTTQKRDKRQWNKEQGTHRGKQWNASRRQTLPHALTKTSNEHLSLVAISTGSSATLNHTPLQMISPLISSTSHDQATTIPLQLLTRCEDRRPSTKDAMYIPPLSDFIDMPTHQSSHPSKQLVNPSIAAALLTRTPANSASMVAASSTSGAAAGRDSNADHALMQSLLLTAAAKDHRRLSDFSSNGYAGAGTSLAGTRQQQPRSLDSTSLFGLGSSSIRADNSHLGFGSEMSRTIELSRQVESEARKQRIQELLALGALRGGTNPPRSSLMPTSSEAMDRLLIQSLSRMDASLAPATAPLLSGANLKTATQDHLHGFRSPQYPIAAIQGRQHSQHPLAPPALQMANASLSDAAIAIRRGNTMSSSEPASFVLQAPLVVKAAAERKERFPVKLFNMILAAEREGKGSIVSFTSSGRGFVLYNPVGLEKDLLPRFMGKIKYASFKRQLHLYEFKYVSKGPEAGSFTHPLFCKGNPEACTFISRPKRLTS